MTRRDEALSAAAGTAPYGDPRIVRRLRRFATVVASCVLGFAAVAIVGYATRVLALFGLRDGGPAMSPVTALAIASLAVLVLQRAAGRRGRFFAVGAGLLAFAAIVSVACFGEDRLSALVAERIFGLSEGRFGTTAPSTALCIAALAFASSPSPDPRFVLPKGLRLADAAGAFGLVISGLGLVGHAYGARRLFEVAPFHAMATVTTACLFALSLATFTAHPTYGWGATIASRLGGGRATRRQLAFTALPPLFGWVLVDATGHGAIDPNTAMALLVALTIVPLALLVLRDGAVLDLLDRARDRIAGTQRRMSAQQETRLAAQAAQLEHQAHERLAAEAALAHTQRLEAIGQLTGGIAHDFNNLLMAVVGNLELMRRRLDAAHPLSRYVGNALAASAKGTKVTQQLLAFSRTQRLEIRPIDVQATLRDALPLLAQALGPTSNVVLDAAEPGRFAAGDADQLSLALLNLAINSRDAMPDGGTIRVAQRFVPAAAPGAGDFVVVSVADDGAGMPPDVIARATEPFFTTKAVGHGTGLGLAQAYGFAKQCGGDLRIHSAVGAGTTIEIWLPAVAAPPTIVATATAPAEAEVAVAITATRSILVIDDDHFVRATIVDALRDRGDAVVEASNGTDGLRELADARPDVAVIDFLMPGMNGAVVAREAQKRLPGLPIVFVSGYSDTVALDGIANAVVLRKPFAFDALFAKIDEVAARAAD